MRWDQSASQRWGPALTTQRLQPLIPLQVSLLVSQLEGGICKQPRAVEAIREMKCNVESQD